MSHSTLSILVLASMSLGACSASTFEHLAKPYKQPPFIPDGLERVVIDENRVRWGIVERRVFSTVGDSVDLWIRRGDPGQALGEPVFLGLAPSCYGRARWITNQKTSQTEGACYLRRFGVSGGEILLQMRLGGDWLTSMAVPVKDVMHDDDGDGWNNVTEDLLGTRRDRADSDGDGQQDPNDYNPLVAQHKAIDQASDLEGALVQVALVQSRACQKNKPLFISGPDRLRRSFTGLPCMLLWRSQNQLTTADRTHRSGAVDLQQINSGTVHISIDAAAREGGIGRVLVDVDRSDNRAPVVRLTHLLGMEIVHFYHSDDGFVPSRREFVMRGRER